MWTEDRGLVVSVSRDDGHRFSKPIRTNVRLIKDHGVEGDAHAGPFLKHRYLAKRQPTLANNRQVHLIQSELFQELAGLGFEVGPGELGENITTGGIDLLKLPLGCLLHLGDNAAIELTGLRTPCGYIDRFRKGLKRAMIVRTGASPTFRAGVLGVVRASGDVACGDLIRAELPDRPWTPLPAL
jgi:MOSC domain-containing protein YiiM